MHIVFVFTNIPQNLRSISYCHSTYERLLVELVREKEKMGPGSQGHDLFDCLHSGIDCCSSVAGYSVVG